MIFGVEKEVVFQGGEGNLNSPTFKKENTPPITAITGKNTSAAPRASAPKRKEKGVHEKKGEKNTVTSPMPQ